MSVSQDCVSWGLLIPPATEEIKEKASIIRGRFSGDPSHEFEQKKPSSNRNEEVIEEDAETDLEADKPVSKLFYLDNHSQFYCCRL